MKKVLFKLNVFCNKNKIEYGVTGTYALDLLGVPSSSPAGDIDIILFHVTDEIRAKLKELQFLSGVTTKEYEPSECYNFLIDGVKINAIVDTKLSYEDIERNFVTIQLIDEERVCHHAISIHRIASALAAKKALHRAKDAIYFLNLVNTLSNF